MDSQTAPGTQAMLPIDPPVPSNPVYIQVSLNPTLIRADWDYNIPAKDLWVIPPHHLVFGAPTKTPSTKPRFPKIPKFPFNKSRFPVTIATTSNMIGCGGEKAKLSIANDNLRCVGVSVDGVPYSSDLQFSVAIAGVVTVACDRKDMCDAAVGDTVYYTFDESPIYFAGLENHRSVRLVAGSPDAPLARIRNHFNSNSEPGDFTVDKQTWEQMDRVLGTLVAFSDEHDECRVLLRI